ncbi:MAG: PIN domain-containing protein [Rhodoferax sp.]|nr:PIN domain-containing protein [Rhodoferax sp.]
MPTMTELPWTIDTNILVYATESNTSATKQHIAKQLLTRLTLSPQACLLGQVVSEFMNVVLRKQAMTHAQAFEAVDLFSQAARVVGASQQAYAQAWKLVATHKYQVWDALIIAICAEHGVKTLYSEDAGSLKRPLGVHVVNPFEAP